MNFKSTVRPAKYSPNILALPFLEMENPVNGTFRVSLPAEKALHSTLKIYNTAGIPLTDVKLSDNGSKRYSAPVPTSLLSGFYYVIVEGYQPRLVFIK